MSDERQASETPEVFVLFGATGEYSDHSEWAVRAYTSKEDADADCAALNAIAADGKRLADEEWASSHARQKAVVERLRAHDANADMDYTGTWYSVGSMPLVSRRLVASSPLAPTQEGA